MRARLFTPEERQRWKTIFDRTGQVEERMPSSWANRPQPDLEALYRQRLASIWHYITRCAISARRQQSFLW